MDEMVGAEKPWNINIYEECWKRMNGYILFSGPKGRRFDSCRVQQAGIIRTRYPSVMDLEFWFIFERKKARSFDLAFLLCLRFLFICIIFRLRERIVHKYAVLPKKIFLFSGLREISSLWKQDRKYICKVHILLYWKISGFSGDFYVIGILKELLV